MKRFWLSCIAVPLFVVIVSLCGPAQLVALDSITCGEQTHTVYGWFRNNLGFFTELDNGSDLASNRTWARGYLDSRFSDNLSLWLATQVVYEPEYDVEKGLEDHGDYHEYDRFEDVVRELYFDYKFNKSHSLRVGRQIVIWGEALTQRVGDVIHPEDTRFAFAFANLEDTRIPQWIVKGTHDFAALGSSVEWLVMPNWVDEEYRVNRAGAPGQQRFAIPAGDNPAHAPGPIWRGIMQHIVPGHVYEELPDDSLEDLRFGFKTSTFLGGAEFGVSYFHTQNYNPFFFNTPVYATIPDGAGPGVDLHVRDYILKYPDMDIIGAYTNWDLPLGLLRAEAIYVPNNSFHDTSSPIGVSEGSYVKYMLAWDLNGYFYFDWHKSAPFDITIEHVGEWVPDADDLKFVIYDTDLESYKPAIGCRLSTNWFYNVLATEVIFSYAFGNETSGLFMPVVKWTPSWNNDMFSAELRYIGLFGEDNHEDLGMFKDKDMVVLTTQINF